MQITRVSKVYFSPCGSTANIITHMAEAAAAQCEAPLSAVDFTLPAAREKTYRFGPEELVFFGTPVYAGRVPNKIMPFIRDGFLGGGALAVPVVTYGNWSFDDGLVELRNLLEDNGFHTIGAAAVVARHSFSMTLGAGRPNEADLREAALFAGRVAEKAEALDGAGVWEPVAVPGTHPPEAYYTPLGIDGNPAKFLKAVPKLSGKCDKCGLCAKVCPMGSIDREDPGRITGICIKCQACVRKCPRQARYFDDAAFLSHKQMLEQNFTAAREASYFV